MSTLVNLTPTQIKRINQIILDLMKNRRFFLADEHGLHQNHFSECIDFYRKLRELYKSRQAQTRQQIEEEERLLGVVPPILKDGQSTVTCSLYTGGLEICEAYTIQQFLVFLPRSYDELYAEMFLKHHGEIGDIAPKKLPEKEGDTRKLADRLWAELQAIKNKEDGVVVILETKFNPTYESGFDILKSRVDDLISSPEGLAYLFYKHECVKRLIKHHFVLFGTDRANHPNVAHWSGDNSPKLTFEHARGYECRTKFVCLI